MSDKPVFLEAVDLEKRYRMTHGQVDVLRGVSLEVAAGEHLAIMGASGAGKSTLLHLLGGLDQPDKGAVRVDGERLDRWSESRRAAFRAKRIGIVFQSYHLIPDLTVSENVLMPARALRPFSSPERAARERARYLLEKVGLGHRLEHRPMELSGGEQQRLAIARALMNDPDLLLADEPTGNLDAATGEQVLNDLFRLSAERGRCLVIVTHDPALAARCHRTIHLAEGRVVEQIGAAPA